MAVRSQAEPGNERTGRGVATVAAVALALIALWHTAARAETPPQLSAALVIRFPDADRLGKPPVVTAVALSGDGQTIAAAGDDHVVRLWRRDGKLFRELRGHTDWVRSVVFHPDGKILASAGDDRQIRLWNVATGDSLTAPAKHPQAIYSLAYSVDGTSLAACGFEHVLRIYSTRDIKPVKEIECPGRDLRTAAFSPDGSQVAVAGREGKVWLFTTSDGKLAKQIDAHRMRIHTLAFSPDGARFASAGDDRMLKLWDAKTGGIAMEFSCRPAKVLSLAFIDADTLATAGSDNAIIVWDLASRRQRWQLAGHTGSVASIAADRQGTALISGSFDTTIRVWQLTKQVSTDATTKVESIVPALPK